MLCTFGSTLLAAASASAEPPPAQTGFQAALRPGLAIPLGSASRGVPMSNVYGLQRSLTLDVGLKPIENLFVGAYLGAGVGGAGSAFDSLCSGASSCSSSSLRIGVEAQFHFRPARLVNPWVGYGIGFESTSSKQELGPVTASQNRNGIEFAHLMAGVDFRVFEVIGVGPYLDFSIAQYGSVSSSSSTQAVQEGSKDIEEKRIHEWLTVGLKITLLP